MESFAQVYNTFVILGKHSHILISWISLLTSLDCLGYSPRHGALFGAFFADTALTPAVCCQVPDWMSLQNLYFKMNLSQQPLSCTKLSKTTKNISKLFKTFNRKHTAFFKLIFRSIFYIFISKKLVKKRSDPCKMIAKQLTPWVSHCTIISHQSIIKDSLNAFKEKCTWHCACTFVLLVLDMTCMCIWVEGREGYNSKSFEAWVI